MSARKAKRRPKARKGIVISQPAKARPYEVVEAEARKAHDPYHKLLAEYVDHPEFKRQSEQNKKKHDAREAAEKRARDVAARKREAAYPVAVNPLTETDFAQSLHNVRCAFSYYRELEVMDENSCRLTDDQKFGRHLLAQVFDSALEALEKQEEFERRERFERHQAELAQAKAGAK